MVDANKDILLKAERAVASIFELKLLGANQEGLGKVIWDKSDSILSTGSVYHWIDANERIVAVFVFNTETRAIQMRQWKEKTRPSKMPLMIDATMSGAGDTPYWTVNVEGKNLIPNAKKVFLVTSGFFRNIKD